MHHGERRHVLVYQLNPEVARRPGLSGWRYDSRGTVGVSFSLRLSLTAAPSQPTQSRKSSKRLTYMVRRSCPTDNQRNRISPIEGLSRLAHSPSLHRPCRGRVVWTERRHAGRHRVTLASAHIRRCTGRGEGGYTGRLADASFRRSTATRNVGQCDRTNALPARVDRRLAAPR